MSEKITRERIVACARTWLGTKFQHQGRRRGQGLDCIGLPVMVAVELGIRLTDGSSATPYMFGDYCAQPIARGARVQIECERLLVQKKIEDALPGDLLVMRIPSEPCHIAMLAELTFSRAKMTTIIHAYSGAKKVVEHIFDDRWRWRVCGAFYFPGVE